VRRFKELIEAQKIEAVGSRVSGVAHDFWNVLAIASGYAYIGLHSANEAKMQESIFGLLHMTCDDVPLSCIPKVSVAG